MRPLSDIPILDDPETPAIRGDRADGRRLVMLETYGCQMNVSDSEIVASVLRSAGYGLTNDPDRADVILLNTCAIRENAEQRVRRRLEEHRARKRRSRRDLRLGVLGCMAERLRHRLLEEEQLVDLVVGPDAYRDIGRLLDEASRSGQAAVNVQLSREETYADIAPVRYDSNGVTAFVSIMRGCDNMCSFCVVPFTRGRERSRPTGSILDEVERLAADGFREVTLLGQNVNSYRYVSRGTVVDFPELVHRVSGVSDELRVRYSTSHPKDCSDELLSVHRDRSNVCNAIHLPVQHGDSGVLSRMRRTYTREGYLELVSRVRGVLPGVSLTTDLIVGFCGETEEEHRATLSLMEEVRFDHAFMFAYSERPDTFAERRYDDDVPEDVKKRRLSEIIELQNRISLESNLAETGREHVVLVEGPSRRSDDHVAGRTDTNKMVVLDRGGLPGGAYVRVRVAGCTSATLFGEVLRPADGLRGAAA